MERVTQETVRELASEQRRPSVSLFMPLHLKAAEKDQDRISYRNLLDKAEQRLVDGGLRKPAARNLLKPARSLQDDRSFWRPNGIEGMGVLIAEDLFRSFALPYACPDVVSVADRFLISPLLFPLGRDERFYLLALSPKAVRLFRANRKNVSPVRLPDNMPCNMVDALAGTEIEKSLQHHVAGPGGRGGTGPAILHGHGEPKDYEKTALTDYFRIIARPLEKLLIREPLPLVLAAVDYCHPMFREICRYPHFTERGIVGSPDGYTEAELLERALPIVEPVWLESVRSAAARYSGLVSSERTSDDLAVVLSAAGQGRVDTLMAGLAVSRWGRFNADAGTAEIHQTAEPGDDDLVDLAVAKTILNGGNAYIVAPEDVPSQSPVAAILRW